MQICFYFPSLKNAQNKAIFGSMYSSFFKALERNGLVVHFTTEVNDIKGDILVVSIGGGGERTAAKSMHKFKGPIIFNIYNASLEFNKSFFKRWSSRALFAYNTDYSKLNYIKCSSVNLKFYDIAFASDDSVFFPLGIKEKKYDITFLGNANSGNGRKEYIELLVKYAQENQLELFLAGYGWDRYGYPYKIVEHGEETNKIYNSSKICINIHNDRQYAGLDKEMDANNRLFDLAMAGCCQIGNGENMVLKYFEKDEVITADDPVEWISKIDYYLKNEEAREIVADNARKRALRDHTWDKRASEFVKIINDNYSGFKLNLKTKNPVYSVLRFLDQYLKPVHSINQIRIIKAVNLKVAGLFCKNQR